ncbi:hypothetical protein MHK_005226 [Candidatus Magnetomorum sp. HK-1]|nr:hypothetical protein MHK_005226 [Candidatus Magnetomorum sp. HK-1]
MLFRILFVCIVFNHCFIGACFSSEKHSDETFYPSLSIPILIDEIFEIESIDIILEFNNDCIQLDKKQTIISGMLENKNYSLQIGNPINDEISVIVSASKGLIQDKGLALILNFTYSGIDFKQCKIKIKNFQINETDIASGGFCVNQTIYRSLTVNCPSKQWKLDTIDLNENLLLEISDVILAMQQVSQINIFPNFENKNIVLKDIMIQLQILSNISTSCFINGGHK